MSDTPPPKSEASAKALPQLLSEIKFDFKTIKIMTVTIIAVLAILVTPLLYVVSKFVDYDDILDRLKIAENLRPRILEGVPEELDSAYSRTALVDAQSGPQLGKAEFMEFHATPDQRVVISIKVIPFGLGSAQPVRLQINGCTIPKDGPGYLHEPNIVLPAALKDCPQSAGDEFGINTLRVTIPGALQKGNQMTIECVVLVYRQVWKQTHKRSS
jgi:hypothetical protein